MICTDVRPLLELLADEALDTKETALIVDHLKSCAQCQSQWSQLEELKERFRRASKATPVPEDLLRKIGRALDGEGTKRSPTSPLSRPLLAFAGAAAALAIIGFFTIAAWLQPPWSVRRSTALASASALVDAVAANRSEPLVERAALPLQLGYNLVYLALPDWKLEHSAVHRTDSVTAIARFDFVKKGAAQSEHLVCYQAPAGTIHAADGQKKLIAGKQVLLGSRGNLHYALWSQQGRDYLFVSPLSSGSLEQLIERV